MNISPDQYILWEYGFFKFNYTILFTWVVMAILVLISLVLKMFLTSEKNLTTLQNIFEVLILGIENQIKSLNENFEMRFLFPFVATLFCFILLSDLLQIIPFFYSPTASLSTTMALMFSVVLFGFVYGISRKGFYGYMKKYIQPTAVMLPLNIMGDVSSNIALAVRLYGNMMSGMIIGLVVSRVIFLSIGLPIFLNILSLITSVVQAYIFSVLAVVFIASAEN